MAGLTSLGGAAQGLSLRASWEEVAGVTTPELSATWCRLTITVNGTDAAMLRTGDGSVGAGVYVSAYPLAEWFSENWWCLWGEQRVSVRPVREWSWRSPGAAPWRQRHNLCGAGGGMFWPDLALVPEGSLVRAVWWPRAAGEGTRGASYLGGGEEWLPLDAAKEGVVSFVNRVVDRLDDQGLSDTPLQRSWRLVQGTTGEEAAFAEAAARLGEDPYSLHDDVAGSLVRLADSLDDDALLAEFLDSVAEERTGEAFDWLTRADARLTRRPSLPRELSALGELLQELAGVPQRRGLRPYELGYAVARLVRSHVGVDPVRDLDLQRFVHVERLPDRSGGIDGYVVADEGLHLAIPERIRTAGSRFRSAQALGLLVLAPARRRFIIDPCSTDLAQASRAFAAEVLAPAAGVAEYLRVLLRADDDAFDAIAGRYNVSPTVIRRQYENQVATPGWGAARSYDL